MATKNNIQEVSRNAPKEGKFYETAEYEYTTGHPYSKANPERWFTTKKLVYVGKYLRHEQKGYGEGCDSRHIFEGANGEEVTVQVDTIDFKTCFREVEEKK
jgi:hypothetical protein